MVGGGGFASAYRIPSRCPGLPRLHRDACPPLLPWCCGTWRDALSLCSSGRNWYSLREVTRIEPMHLGLRQLLSASRRWSCQWTARL